MRISDWSSDVCSSDLEFHGEEKDKPAEQEWETVNRASALWTRPRTEVKDEEYQEFYKHVAHDFDNPLSWSHNKVEGKLEYTSLQIGRASCRERVCQDESITGVTVALNKKKNHQ